MSLELLDEIGQIKFLILPQYIVHSLYLRDLPGFELCVAPRHDEDGIRVLPADAMNHLPVLMVGSVRHGAGVDDADIRFFALFGTRVTALNERFAKRTALRKIQLAP